MTRIIDPWGSDVPKDYSRIIDDFGLEIFNKEIFPNSNRIMRRNVVIAGRDLKIISKCISEKKDFYVLSGIMPTADKVHFGTKMVVENIKYFQEQGARTYILVADLEAMSTRNVSLEEARRRAMEFQIPAYVALGLDIEKTWFYLQSENIDVMHMAYNFSRKITQNEFRAIYGNTDPGRIFGAVTQVGDILFPQLESRSPGIIPVGIDQDPHIRLTRDIVNRTKSMKYFSPSSIYHKYTPALNGDLKMSKHLPESCIDLPEDPKIVCKKLMRALTGGRDSAEEQKKKGGQPDKCVLFEFYKQHLIEDDAELDDIFKKCTTGKILCGECKKEYACKRMTLFMEDFNEKVKKAQKELNKIKFIKFK